jgi:hypothetical protein
MGGFHGNSGAPLVLSGLGGLVTLAGSDSVPMGASPRTYDTDFDVGNAKTRPGLTNVYPIANASIGPNPPTLAASTTWTDPNALLTTGVSFASVGAPGSPVDFITATEFAFNVPSTTTVVGLTVSLTAYATVATGVFLTAQLVVNGTPIGVIKQTLLPDVPTVLTFGAPTDNWGNVLSMAVVNEASFGIQFSAWSLTALQTAFINGCTMTIGANTGTSNFQYITTFTAQDGSVRNLALDASGNFYVENLTSAPGQLNLVLEGITPNSLAVGTEGPGVEYLAFTQGNGGVDMPIQYTPQWIDRITQVGPGAAPVFTPQVATAATFPIATITQPPQKSDPADPGHFQALLWSVGPTSTAPGNVITVFYAQSVQDTDLTTAFNSGNAVYVYVSATPIATANGTFLVTSVGKATPPGGGSQRFYFTYQVSTSNYQFYGGPDSATGFYQRTLATLTTTGPVPGLVVGNNITVAGSSVASWDAQWQITQALNSAAMTVTSTQVIASVATIGYAVSSGTAPVAGQLVTITGTTNANGQLNLTNATIQSSTGGMTGTFTLNVSFATAAFSPESGYATTAGSIFAFDPGIGTLGTASNPIFGNATGGTLTFTSATAQLISPGTRQGTVFFITRNDYFTAPAPPVTFTCPENTTGILVTQIPVGPPNVIARGIAITEAGQNGTPGGNFYWLATPVTYIVNNVSYTASSFRIDDNVATSATLNFTDYVLLGGGTGETQIDRYGYNLFNQIEIGDPGWLSSYAGRNWYGQCINKIQNFNNLSFDGGYLPGGVLVPLGWSTPDAYGSLLVSAKFGNSYYIQNTSGSVQPIAGLISQTAFQDAYQQPILYQNTAYSVRLIVRSPSAATSGQITVDLEDSVTGQIYGAQALLLANITSNFAIYTGTLLTVPFAKVPSTVQLRVYAQNLPAGGDVEIDRIDIFPTAIPVLSTTVYGSYAGLPEQVDGSTGQVEFISENQQPVNGSMVMYDTFYALKGWTGNAPGSSMYSLQASANLEPAQWDEPEVAQRLGGACGPLAFDLGEQWYVGATRSGLYVFVGGQPGRINMEIYQVWDAIAWSESAGIWVLNDEIHRRLLAGVPMQTPNFWLPNAPPQTPAPELVFVSSTAPSGRTPGIMTVTFASNLPPFTSGQSYTFGPITGASFVSGQTLYPSSVSGNQAIFVGGFADFSGASTGMLTAISGISLINCPNVVLMCNYQGIDSGEGLKTMPQMHTTMFGTLNAIDMRRKWSIWQIPSPYAALVQGQTDQEIYICNGRGNSQIYKLDPESTSDAGLTIDSLYTTAGMPELSKRAQAPGVGGFGNTRTGYLWASLESRGNVAVRFLPNRLIYPETVDYLAWTLPGGFSPGEPALQDCQSAVNFWATRTFVEFRENDGYAFSLSNCAIQTKKDPWNALVGSKTG